MLLKDNCLTALQKLEADSVASIVTDPPYGLGFMGKQWDSLPPGQEVFEQCLRVLKPGGHLLCFGGSRTYHRMAVAVEDAGFEIRDQIMWVYGSDFPKSQNIGAAVDKIQGNKRENLGKYCNPDGTTRNYDNYDKKCNVYVNERQDSNEKRTITQGKSEWEGWHTAIKPAHEPIVLARKPIEKGLSIARNCLKWGGGAINVDGCRVEYQSESDKKYGHSGSESAKRGNDTSYSPPCSTSRKDPSQGRFPANLCHDGSPEVVGLFPVTNPSRARKKPSDTISEPTINIGGGYKSVNNEYTDSGSAARFFYTPKAKKKERLTFNNHPTVKPVTLMQYLVRLITPAGGTCLDPFAGSGTTGLACMKEGRSYILIDSDSGSIDIARRRLLSEIISQEYSRAARRRLNTHRSQLQIF